jgi:signal transduction histidine kinase
MSERDYMGGEWIGRLVRVLIVFRTLVLLITVLSLPRANRTPVVGLAVILAAVVSYLPLRHWRRVASSLSRHPTYLALEVLLATLILAAAGAHSPFFYFTLGTAVLAGVIYGRRGAIPFSALLMAAYELVALEGFSTSHQVHDVQSLVFAPLLYPAAIAAGIAAREMVERGVETEALLREQGEDLAGERERLRVARELHDSLAKTVEGLAMSASMLPTQVERSPAAATAASRQLAEDARQAASEARVLMSNLRPSNGIDVPFADAVRRDAEGFAQRSGAVVRVVSPSGELDRPGLRLAPATRHELLRILGEALRNGVRHGGAANLTVLLEENGDGLLLSVSDDGCGLPQPIDVERLKAGGHYGLAGMHERARAIGGVLSVHGQSTGGTIVSVHLPSTPADRGAAPELDSGADEARRFVPGMASLRRVAVGDRGLRE